MTVFYVREQSVLLSILEELEDNDVVGFRQATVLDEKNSR